MQRRNTVARAVLLWLYDEDENYPLVEDFLELPAAGMSGEIVSNDELVRIVRWLDDKGLIDGLRIDQVPYPVKLRLTPAGRIVVAEQDGWVQPEATAATSPVRVVAQAFLRWLYDHNSEQSTPKDFLSDARSIIGEHQIDETEMTEAVELLVAKALVKGGTAWGNPIPLRISLTDAGRICVTDHDADPAKAGPFRTSDEVAHGVVTIDKTINVEGNGNWIIAHSENATQAQKVDPRLQPEFSVKLGARVPGKGYRFTLTMHGGPEQLNVSVAVAVLEPQDGVSASATSNGTRLMVRDFPREVVLHMDPPLSPTPVFIDVIATCLDVDHPGRRWTLHRALRIPQPAKISRASIGRLPRSTEVRRHPDR